MNMKILKFKNKNMQLTYKIKIIYFTVIESAY